MSIGIDTPPLSPRLQSMGAVTGRSGSSRPRLLPPRNRSPSSAFPSISPVAFLHGMKAAAVTRSTTFRPATDLKSPTNSRSCLQASPSADPESVSPVAATKMQLADVKIIRNAASQHTIWNSPHVNGEVADWIRILAEATKSNCSRFEVLLGTCQFIAMLSTRISVPPKHFNLQLV